MPKDFYADLRSSVYASQDEATNLWNGRAAKSSARPKVVRIAGAAMAALLGVVLLDGAAVLQPRVKAPGDRMQALTISYEEAHAGLDGPVIGEAPSPELVLDRAFSLIERIVSGAPIAIPERALERSREALVHLNSRRDEEPGVWAERIARRAFES